MRHQVTRMVIGGWLATLACIAGDLQKRALELTAPTFITESHVWINANNRLEILLPHPNSDGIDPSGAETIRYEISIMDGCVPFYTTTVSKSQYPHLYRLPFDLALDTYNVAISRKTTAGKRDESEGTVIVGPGGPGVPGISSDFLEIERWLLHVPKVGGGFRGQVTLSNRFPQLPAEIWISGFDANGVSMPNTQLELIIIGQQAQIDIYGANGLFPSSLLDQISHIGLYESNHNRTLTTAITYQSTQDNALTATVEEVDFVESASVGVSFSMEARKSERFWDGVAILNLAGLVSANVDAVFRRVSDGAEIGRSFLGSVAPGSKELYVVSDLFDFSDDTFYTIETGDNRQTVQVLGLRGNFSQANPLLVGSTINKNL